MKPLLQKFAAVLLVCLAAFSMCGFTLAPPEDWESLDPKFHLVPPTVKSSTDASTNFTIIDGTSIVLPPDMSWQEEEARVVPLIAKCRGFFYTLQ